MDHQNFFKGEVFDAYEYFGAHLTNDGVVFRAYAPNAQGVAVVGDFNGWKPYHMSNDNGFWSIEINGAKEGDIYK